MDISGCHLNMKSYDILKQIDTSTRKNQRDINILPPIDKIEKLAKEVNDISQIIVLFKTYLGLDVDIFM